MKIVVNRLKSGTRGTIGTLSIDGEFECFTVEDTVRDAKVAGITAIPAGEYEIKLRNEGGMTKKYASRFPNHQGMLWLQDVPGFEWVYIHIGNKAEDSEGCLLVNAGVDSSLMTGSKSRDTYIALYRKILEAIDDGDIVTVAVR